MKITYRYAHCSIYDTKRIIHVLQKRIIHVLHTRYTRIILLCTRGTGRICTQYTLIIHALYASSTVLHVVHTYHTRCTHVSYTLYTRIIHGTLYTRIIHVVHTYHTLCRHVSYTLYTRIIHVVHTHHTRCTHVSYTLYTRIIHVVHTFNTRYYKTPHEITSTEFTHYLTIRTLPSSSSSILMFAFSLVINRTFLIIRSFL